ncbi:MAG: tryptophan-rich sensory protein [bacterium]|nr:tryptophan-rich sensory protein [bacterium]
MIDLTWYNTLNLPAYTPPSWIFAPVWSLIYLSIIVSFLVFVLKPTLIDKKLGYVVFLIQAFLNVSWMPVFFIFHQTRTALIILILLCIFTIFNIKEFYKVSKFAGLLLVPYLIWLLFATYLSFGVMVLN